MSKASRQMDNRTIDEIYANPCGYCYDCGWKKQHDCYDPNPAQCSICSIILSVIDKCREEENMTQNTTPNTGIDSIPEIDQMLAWVYKCGWYASNDWNDWTKDIEAVIRKAKRQIQKIIERDVIGSNYTKRRRVLSNAIYTHQRQRKGGGTEVVERDTALVANSVRNKQRQALTKALYGEKK